MKPLQTFDDEDGRDPPGTNAHPAPARRSGPAGRRRPTPSDPRGRLSGRPAAEGELAAEFFVSRNTVREALAALKTEGLIGRGPKVGTHVAIRKYDHGLDALVGLKATFKGYGEIRNVVRAAMPVAAPPSVANRLQLSPGEEVIFVERLRFLGDLPVSLDMTYLAPDIGAAVLESPLETNDIFALIEEATGQRLGTAGLAVEAVAADAHTAAILQVPDGAAVLLLERLTHLDDGRPVDLEYIRMRGDRITLRGNLLRGTS